MLKLLITVVYDSISTITFTVICCPVVLRGTDLLHLMSFSRYTLKATCVELAYFCCVL